MAKAKIKSDAPEGEEVIRILPEGTPYILQIKVDRGWINVRTDGLVEVQGGVKSFDKVAMEFWQALASYFAEHYMLKSEAMQTATELRQRILDLEKQLAEGP